METFDGVRDAIVRAFALRNGESIGRDTTSADVAGWDSLSHSLLLMAVEEQFAIDLPLDRVYEAQNVGELVDLIDEVRSHA
ncbi:MAG TPA: acyl carrier protein [Candidatus Baltobacteraceae bacterium]|nr:acyl carrier protein [Candidatus Baltobacteraceae bacterium]